MGGPYRITAAHVDSLDQLGFEWDPCQKTQHWDAMFERLQRFQLVNGHANVPRRYAEDPELGRWVYKRRKSRRGESKYKISPEQIARLDTVGFQWEFGSMHNWRKIGPKGLKSCAPEAAVLHSAVTPNQVSLLTDPRASARLLAP